MRLLHLLLASMVGASWAATTGTVSVAISSQNNAVLAPTCVNGQWQIKPAYNLAVTVTAGGATNTAVPSTNNGAVNAQFVAAYLIGGKPAPTSVTNAQGTAASAAQTNTWVFKPANGVTTQTATVNLKVNPACTTATAKPTVTTMLSSPSSIVVPGGNGVTAITTATAVAVVNKLPAVNNAGTKAAATTAAPTTAAPTAAAVVGACSLVVPAKPLTAAGLSTPYVVSGNGCTQVLAAATFVQGAVLDLTTGALSNYNPLVILKGTTPAIAPTVPKLPANNIVALWFGTNAMTTTLVATIDPANGVSSLVEGACVNGGGTPPTIFGQFAACNGPAFFAAAAKLIAAKLLVIPPLGVDNINANPCPTTHDFGVVDQDPSDNTDTTYLTLANGQTAQDTPANQAALTKAGKTFVVVDNGSDQKLITLMQPRIGCKTFTIPDLADTAATPQLVPNFAANELQALNSQQTPIAVIPANDPMVVDGNAAPNLAKLNAFKAQIGQAPLQSLAGAPTLAFCQNLFAVGAPRILSWISGFVAAPPPDFAAGLSNTLAGVLSARFQATVGAGNLNCAALMAAAQKATSTSYQLMDVSTTYAPVATTDVPIDTTLDMTLNTPFDIFMWDSAGNLILPTTFDENGTFPASMSWEEAVGIPEQKVALDPTDAPVTTDTTTTSSGMSMTIYIAIGAGAAVLLLVVIAVAVYIRRKRAASFETNAQQTAQMTKV